MLGVFGDRYARIVVLHRRKNGDVLVLVSIDAVDDTTSARAGFETCQLLVGGSICRSNGGGSIALGVAPCS